MVSMPMMSTWVSNRAQVAQRVVQHAIEARHAARNTIVRRFAEPGVVLGQDPATHPLVDSIDAHAQHLGARETIAHAQ